jgi:hypothetical protein
MTIIFLYRAYGYIILEKFDSALKDLMKASTIKKLNTAAFYNLLIC